VTRRVRILGTAEAELTSAVGWYEAQRSGLGGAFFDAVVRTLARVVDQPEEGSAAFEVISVRRILVSGFPYQIIYRLDGDEIRVIAFAHWRRRPGFWRRRR